MWGFVVSKTHGVHGVPRLLEVVLGCQVVMSRLPAKTTCNVNAQRVNYNYMKSSFCTCKQEPRRLQSRLRGSRFQWTRGSLVIMLSALLQRRSKCGRQRTGRKAPFKSGSPTVGDLHYRWKNGERVWGMRRVVQMQNKSWRFVVFSLDT